MRTDIVGIFIQILYFPDFVFVYNWHSIISARKCDGYKMIRNMHHVDSLATQKENNFWEP